MPMSPRLLRPRATAAMVAVDADARTYINAVRTADGGQYMEAGVQRAIDAFIIGCKSDGIWTAIKASCILMGARTLSGALTPLVGTAPTNTNFVSGDYNRKTGLLGNGSTKYLNSNRASNANPQNSVHISVYVSSAATNTTRTLIGDTAAANGQTILNGVNDGTLYTQARVTAAFAVANVSGEANTTGFKGVARAVSTEITRRSGGSTSTASSNSQTPSSENFGVFARTPSSPALYSSDRIAFYSIGEALTLATLDSRVSTLYTAIGAAIP